MKTTLDKDLLSRPGDFVRQRTTTSPTVLVPMLNLGVANDMIQIAAILAMSGIRDQRPGIGSPGGTRDAKEGRKQIPTPDPRPPTPDPRPPSGRGGRG